MQPWNTARTKVCHANFSPSWNSPFPSSNSCLIALTDYLKVTLPLFRIYTTSQPTTKKYRRQSKTIRVPIRKDQTHVWLFSYQKEYNSIGKKTFDDIDLKKVKSRSVFPLQEVNWFNSVKKSIIYATIQLNADLAQATRRKKIDKTFFRLCVFEYWLPRIAFLVALILSLFFILICFSVWVERSH